MASAFLVAKLGAPESSSGGCLLAVMLEERHACDHRPEPTFIQMQCAYATASVPPEDPPSPGPENSRSRFCFVDHGRASLIATIWPSRSSSVPPCSNCSKTDAVIGPNRNTATVSLRLTAERALAAHVVDQTPTR